MAPDVMTAQQAASYLQLGVDSLKRKARAGVIPAAKIGRDWRFRKTELDTWLAHGGTLDAAYDKWFAEECERRDREPALTREQIEAEFGL